MELILTQHRPLFQVFSELLHAKYDNIFYEEEGIIPTGETLQAALEKIQAEIGEMPPGIALTIIDKYFTSVKCADAEEIVEILFEWAEKASIGQINIYSAIKGNCFESRLVERFDGSIPLCLYKIPKQIHDRYWIFNETGNFSVVSVGTSLNGLGKQLCLVQKILPTDKDELLDIFKELKIDF